MSEPLKMWRIAGGEELLPRLVDCPNGLWPEHDADGCKIFKNTHFENRDDAVQNMEESHISYIKYWGNQVLEARKKIVKAQEEASNAAANYAAFKDAEWDFQIERPEENADVE